MFYFFKLSEYILDKTLSCSQIGLLQSHEASVSYMLQKQNNIVSPVETGPDDIVTRYSLILQHISKLSLKLCLAKMGNINVVILYKQKGTNRIRQTS